MLEASELSVSIPSDTGEGLVLQEKIISLMEKHEYSMRDIFAMRLSLEEALTNAIKHGNGNDPNKQVSVVAHVSDERMHVVVKDEGEGFDPGDVPDPTADQYIDRPCGRGVMLMRAYLNFVEYSDGGRTITMERERNSDLPIVDDDDD